MDNNKENKTKIGQNIVSYPDEVIRIGTYVNDGYLFDFCIVRDTDEDSITFGRYLVYDNSSSVNTPISIEGQSHWRRVGCLELDASDDVVRRYFEGLSISRVNFGQLEEGGVTPSQ